MLSEVRSSVPLSRTRRKELNDLFHLALSQSPAIARECKCLTRPKFLMAVKSLGIIPGKTDMRIILQETAARSHITRAEKQGEFLKMSDDEIPVFNSQDFMAVGEIEYSDQVMEKRIRDALHELSTDGGNTVEINILRHHLWRTGILTRLSYDEIDAYLFGSLQLHRSSKKVKIDMILKR